MPKTKKKPAPHKKATKPAKKVKAKAKVTAKPKAKAKPKAAPKAKAKPASKAKTKPTTAKPTQTASFKYSLFERLKAWAELFLKRPDLDVKVPLKISTESNNESSAPKLPDDAEAFAKQAKSFSLSATHKGSDSGAMLYLSLEAFNEPAYLELDGEEVPAYDEGPVNAEYKLSFKLKDIVMQKRDHRFEKAIGGKVDEGEEDGFEEAYAKRHRVLAHRLGGHPTFVQSDPREVAEYKKKRLDVVLLCIESLDGIMWGDCGVGSFLISEANLRKRKFDQVLYYWDCG